MADSADHVIALLLPIIAEGFISFKTLNLLARTNTTLRHATRDCRLVHTVAKNAPAMSKTAIRKLFVLPRSAPLTYMYHPSIYAAFSVIPRCKMIYAAEMAMAVHGCVRMMAKAFHVRQRRSAAMKLFWKQKKAIQEAKTNARRLEIDDIKADLFMIPSSDHITTDAEMYYDTYGVVKRLGRVYRNKRVMALNNAGLLHIGGGVINSFLRVARVDMTNPDELSHTEKLFILRHNMAWEHYLLNYSNFTSSLLSVADVVMDVDHLEFLYPLPTRWPWISQDSLHTVEHFAAAELPVMFQRWLALHDALYDDP